MKEPVDQREMETLRQWMQDAHEEAPYVTIT